MSNIVSKSVSFLSWGTSIKHTIKACAMVGVLISLTPIATATSYNNASDVTMSRGEYLSHAGDCMACHTNNPDKPYAGGHGLASPLGTIYATNITPDKTYGIGTYTFEDFDNAVRRGTSKNHGSLYPAMPFVSYAKMNNEDIMALYEYFMTEVDPIAEPNIPTDIEWPLNMRFPLAIWNSVIADTSAFQPNTSKSDEELFLLLKEGKNQTHAFAGPMADVTSYSLRHLTDADIQSMIVYLRDIELPAPNTPKTGNSFNPQTEGYIMYQDLCSTCHGASGGGVKSVAPTLRDRGNGEQGRSLNIAQALLSGAETAHREDRMPYSMPSYAEILSNEQIAEIVNFIMNNKEWNNHNLPITAKDVEQLKSQEPAIRGWWVIAGGIIVLSVIVGFLIYRRIKSGQK